MATKSIKGTITNGYTLSDVYSKLSIRASASITGAAGENQAASAGTVDGGVGVYLSSPAVVVNAGVVRGGVGGNGSQGGAGGAGLYLKSGGSVINKGLIAGGAGGIGSGGADGVAGVGVVLAAGGRIDNAAGGSIVGSMGVYAGAAGAATLVNDGAIVGTSGVAVAFGSSSDRLVAHAGSTIVGLVEGGGGTLELAAASGTITGLGAVGTASGSAALSFSGFGSYLIDTGDRWTLSGVNSLTKGRTLTNKGTLTIAGSLTNTGVIGGGGGIVLATGANVSNGMAGSTRGKITSAIGVRAGAGTIATVTNFGTIQGTGGTAVQFGSSGDRLIAEAGSSFIGAVKGGGGTLELAAANGTITGLGASGTISGAEAITISGFGAYVLDAGGSWTLSAANSLAAGRTLTAQSALTVAGTLTNAGLVAGGAGLILANGGRVTNAAGGTILGATGLYAVAGGASTVTNAGTLQGTGGVSVSFASSGDRLIAAAGSTFIGVAQGGGGTLELSSGSGTITGLGGYGTVSGAEALTFSGFGAYALDAGSSWTLAGVNSLAAGKTLTSLGALTLAGSLINAGVIAGGAGMVVTTGGGLNNAGGASISGAKAGVDAAAFATVTNSGTLQGTGANGYGVILEAGGQVANGAAATTAVITGVYTGLSALAFASVTNAGTISGTILDGVRLKAGGYVLNGGPGATTALIAGVYAGVYAQYGAARIVNLATITASASAGVQLTAGGTVVNGSTTMTGALISGYFTGVYMGSYGHPGAASAVTNYGTIHGGTLAGVLLEAGGSVTNGSAAGTTATILGGEIGVYVYAGQTATATVTNFGTIQGTYSEGVALGAGGAVTNVAGGLITGFAGVYAGAGFAATVTNFGTIRATGVNSVLFRSTLDRLIIEAGSTLVGVAQGGAGTLELAAGAGTISNLGTSFTGFGVYTVDAGGSWALTGTSSLAIGRTLTNHGTLTLAGTLTNSGGISGGIVLASGARLINGRAAAPTATLSGVVYAGPGGAATVSNVGTLQGVGGIAVQFASAGDRLIAAAGSTILGLAKGGGGTLELSSGGVTIMGLGAVGTVSGAESLGFSGFGTYALDAGAARTLSGTNQLAAGQTLSNLGTLVVGGSLINAGVINSGPGISLAAGASVYNAAGALISASGGLYAGAGVTATVTNFGTLQGTAGSASVRFSASADRLIAQSGSTFIGAVQGGGGTLELSSGTETITGLGVRGTVSGAEALTFSGFGTYALDAGGSCTLAGTNRLAAGQTLVNQGALTVTGTLTNAGAVSGGIVLASGGRVINAAAATISGAMGVYAGAGGTATLTNSGTIQGGGGVAVRFASSGDRLIASAGSVFLGAVQGGGGVLELSSGSGAITGLGANGTVSGAAAISFSGFGSYLLDAGSSWTVQGANSLGASQSLTVGGTLNNVGTMTGAMGISLTGGGSIANAAGADLSSVAGLYSSVGAVVTVSNAGTIEGTGGAAIRFRSSSDRLILQAGATFLGVVQGGGGVLELAATGGALTGLGTAFVSFGAINVDSGGNWALTGSNVVAAGAALNVAGALTLTGRLANNGAVTGAAASVITLDGATIVGGLLQSTGVVNVIDAGNVLDGRSNTVANASKLSITDGATLTVEGAIANAGAMTLAAQGAGADLIVAVGGATFSGGGSITLTANALNVVTGASAATVLSNLDNTITGSGQIGDGKMILVNGAAGVIRQTGAVALTIDTGAQSISNAGLIEATGSGGATIVSALTNTGLLEAAGGDLSVVGAVSGGGSGLISGGVLSFLSSFSQNVAFIGTSGTLELAKSQAFTGAVSGFALSGADALDLRDIAFVNPGEATFSGTTAGGVLTISDGAHSAQVKLQGDYTHASWTASSDGAGGVVIVAGQAPLPSHQAFVSAMAGMRSPAPSPGPQANGGWSPGPMHLVTPHPDAL